MESLCRNCLFDSFSREQFERNIEEYVKSLSPEDQSGERLYEKRLQLCSECADCIEGLCRVCGCFVMARASKKQAYCPAITPRW